MLLCCGYSDKLGSFICAIRKVVVPLHRFPVGEPAARQICINKRVGCLAFIAQDIKRESGASPEQSRCCKF